VSGPPQLGQVSANAMDLFNSGRRSKSMPRSITPAPSPRVEPFFEDRFLKKLRFLARSFSASCALTCPSSRNRTVKSPRRRRLALCSWHLQSSTKNRRGEEPEQNTEQRTRDSEPEGNAPARVLGDRICLHAIFLKRSKIDISQNVNCFSTFHPGVSSKMGTRALRALLLSTVRLAIRAIDLVSETFTVQPAWFLPANAR
jgi:hypothetical protein